MQTLSILNKKLLTWRERKQWKPTTTRLCAISWNLLEQSYLVKFTATNNRWRNWNKHYQVISFWVCWNGCSFSSGHSLQSCQLMCRYQIRNKISVGWKKITRTRISCTVWRFQVKLVLIIIIIYLFFLHLSLVWGSRLELKCKQIKADGEGKVAVVHMECDRCVYGSCMILSWVFCGYRLVQEADRKVQELKVTVASLSMSLSERENQISEVQNALVSREKVL